VRRLRCQPAPPQDHDCDRQLRRLYRRIQPQEDDFLRKHGRADPQVPDCRRLPGGAGSIGITSASDDLRKVFTAPNFGIALKSADAVNRLNGRFPRSLADTELPMGRAFIVRSGITNMLQLATPYANDDDTEGSLDTWVRRINERHPVPNVPGCASRVKAAVTARRTWQDEPTAVMGSQSGWPRSLQI
jgi:hypothetical protein